MPVNKKNKKRITIDSLAIMVKHGFDAVDKRFDAVDKRFDTVDKRFDAVDKRFDKIEKKVTDNTIRIEAISAKLNSLDRRMMYIEDRLTEIVKQGKKEFNKIKRDLAEMKNQKKIDKKRLLEIEKRVEKLELKTA